MTATVVLALSITLQVVATVLALRLIRTSGGTRAWALLAGAIGLMTVRRIITLAEALGAETSSLSLRAELVALAISILMVSGMAAIRPLLGRMRGATELEASFGRVLENSLGEFYIFSADDLRFLRVNMGAQENLGYSTSELYRMTPLDLKDEFTEAAFRETLAPLLAETVPRVQFKTHHRRKDGSRYPVVVDIQKTQYQGRTAFISAILDTSEQDEAERALRDSEEHFRSLIEHSQDLTTVLEWDGTIAYSSPSVEQVLGHDPEQRLGKSGLEMIHPDDKGAVAATLATARAKPETAQTLVYRVRHDNGSWHTMEGIGSVRQLPDGRQQFVINQRDISRRADALREKAEVEAQLQHAQRIEVLGTLAGGVAHDFNNMLTPILGYATLLKEKFAGQPAAREDLDEILRAAARAQRLVRQLLTFSRQADQKLMPTDLQSTVSEALELVRSVLPTNVVMHVHLEAPEETVLVDSTQIHQVIMNLCTNAEQAMRARGGTLTVGLTKVEGLPEEADGYASAARGSFLRLSIGDTGPGMDEATAERVFDPFFTTKGVGEGSGLGLAIVQGIVLNHQGVLSVDTAPGEGARFDIFLPALGVAVEPLETEAQGDDDGNEHILVVDDEATVALVIKRLLESRGYRATVAIGPDEALSLLAAGQDPDLVVTDQTMPSMTGLELAKEIHQTWPTLPVVLVTGFSHAITEERRAQAGIAATMNKPFAGPELAQCVRSVLDNKIGESSV